MNKFKFGLKCAGCALLWLATALSISLEALLINWIVPLEKEVAQFGEEEIYAAEYLDILGFFLFANLIPLLFLLTLAIFCTHKLRRKKGTPCTPNS